MLSSRLLSFTHKVTALQSVAHYTFIAGDVCKTRQVPDGVVQMQDHSHHNQGTIIPFPIPLSICQLMAPRVVILKTSEGPSSSYSSAPFHAGAQTCLETSSDLRRGIQAWCSDIKLAALYYKQSFSLRRWMCGQVRLNNACLIYVKKLFC